MSTGSKRAAAAKPSADDRRVARRGRRGTRAGAGTRTRILDAAELLFARNGYDGTSLRDVSEAADQHLALSTYHFGSKERLFHEVVARRAQHIHALRMQALEAIDISLTGAEAVPSLIQGYVSPLIEARFGRDPQWSAYVQLLAGLVNLRRWSSVLKSNFDQSAYAYLARFRTALPGADQNALLDAFMVMVGSMLYICSKSDRFARDRKHRNSETGERKAVLDDLVRFLSAGFMALEKRR